MSSERLRITHPTENQDMAIAGLQLKLRGPMLYAGLAAVLCAACTGEVPAPPVASESPRRTLVLYASLPEPRLSALARRYQDATGVRLHFLSGDGDLLIEKMRLKEHRPGADVLLLSSVTDLSMALDADILRPVRSETLAAVVPGALRDQDGYWFGVGQRAEWIIYDSRDVQATHLGGYSDLAAAEWRERLCLQRSSSGRSRSLVATLIAELGERDAELVVRGWRANLATEVFDTQSDLLQAIATGECSLGIVSSNEAALYVADGGSSHVRVHAPSDEQGGSWLQPLGAGVSRHASDAEGARLFLEWLVTADGQAALHAEGADYPLHSEPGRPALLADWPLPDAEGNPALRAGYLHQEATLLNERARYR